MTESLRPLDFRDEVEEEKAAHDKRIMDQLFDKRMEELRRTLKSIAEREPGWDSNLVAHAFIGFARLAGGTATGVMPRVSQVPPVLTFECTFVMRPANSDKRDATSPTT